jgi:hypothetical protein
MFITAGGMTRHIYLKTLVVHQGGTSLGTFTGDCVELSLQTMVNRHIYI